MANSLNIDNSSYEGALALPYVAPAILAADSIARGYITVKENVKYKAVLKKLSGSSIAPAACDFTATEDALTLAEAILQPTELMSNVQLCKKDFRQDWEAMQTGQGFINDEVPANFEAFLLQYLAAKVAEAIERNMWQGNYDGEIAGAAPYTDFDGIMKKVVDGTPGYEDLVTGAFTGDANASTGIITHLNSLVGGLPDVLANSDNTKVMMSKKSLFLLHQAFASIGTAGGYAPAVGTERPATYLGFDIITPAGFPNDTLLAAEVANLFFGTDLQGDFNQAVVVDMTQTDASDNVRVAMRFTGGTQVAFLGDVATVRREA